MYWNAESEVQMAEKRVYAPNVQIVQIGTFRLVDFYMHELLVR